MNTSNASASLSSTPTKPASQLAVLAPLVRIALGGLLIFSGYMKLGIYDFGGYLPDAMGGRLPVLSPLDFAFSIKGFKMGLPDGLVSILAYVVPWTELLAGVFIVIGLWTRGAALLAMAMLAAFTLGIISVIGRGLDVNCPCFGAIKLFCSGAIGPCHIVRNSGFMAACLFLLWTGSGPLAFDRAGSCKATPTPA